MPRDASELAHRLAAGRGGVPPLSLQRPARGPLLAGRRCPQHAGPLDVRPAQGAAKGAAPANGPTPRPASMAICSMSSARAAAFVDFHDVADEAGAFSACPAPTRSRAPKQPRIAGADRLARSGTAAVRHVAADRAAHSRNVSAQRGITALHEAGSLRFHPRCYYRPDEHAPTETWPAMIAAVTDLDGRITGAHRTWLDPDGFDATLGKAPIDTPRRAMGDLLGHAVRFGVASEVMAAGEGIETVLSLRCVAADHADGRGALGSASRRHPASRDAAPALYRPRQRSGRRRGAMTALIERARSGRDRGDRAVAAARRLQRGSARLGVDALRAAFRVQLAPQDVARFMLLAA